MGSVISEFGSLVGSAGRDIQCNVVPDSATTVIGAIIQYIGQTDSNYINGYFYKNTSNGWVQENVQPEANISEKQDKTLATPLTINGQTESTVEGALGGLNDYGDALKDNLAANENVYGAKNLIDVVKWLQARNVGYYVVSDTVINISLSSTNITNPYVIADSDKELTLSAASLVNSGNEHFRIELLDSSNSVVATLDESHLSATGIGSKIKGDFSNYGTVTLTEFMLRDARIIDDTFVPFAKTNLQLTNDKAEKSQLSNPNLLDNPFFTVNQRGASSYSTAGNYTANRWYMPFGGLTVGISSSGSTLTATGDTVFDQKLETDELKGKTVTLSIMHFDGTIEHGTVQFPSTAGTAPVVITGGELQAGVDTYGNCYFRIVILTGNTITARAVKLELGSVSTLANDVEPDYAFELAKCRASTADPSDTYANKGNLVNYADMTSIYATGSTNTTGATIANGTFFYLNGQFCKAIADIAVNATFTLDTNFKVDTAGEEIFNNRKHKGYGTRVIWDADSTIHDIPSDGMIVGIAAANSVITLYCNTYDWGFIASGTSTNQNAVAFPCHAGERWSCAASGTGNMLFFPYTY